MIAFTPKHGWIAVPFDAITELERLKKVLPHPRRSRIEVSIPEGRTPKTIGPFEAMPTMESDVRIHVFTFREVPRADGRIVDYFLEAWDGPKDSSFLVPSECMPFQFQPLMEQTK